MGSASSVPRPRLPRLRRRAARAAPAPPAAPASPRRDAPAAEPVPSTPAARAPAPCLEVDSRLRAPGLDQTPSGDQMRQYRYYCPLCMDHFRGVLECECCHHYVCHDCALE